MFGLGHKKPKVLLVDDEEGMRITLADRLEFNNFKIFTAADGNEGLSKATANNPDIIITDINMPHMNGLEMIKAIQAAEAGRNIPIIVVSGSDSDNHKKEAMLLGAVYMAKPLEMSELLGEIENLLELSAATAQPR